MAFLGKVQIIPAKFRSKHAISTNNALTQPTKTPPPGTSSSHSFANMRRQHTGPHRSALLLTGETAAVHEGSTLHSPLPDHNNAEVTAEAAEAEAAVAGARIDPVRRRRALTLSDPARHLDLGPGNDLVSQQERKQDRWTVAIPVAALTSRTTERPGRNATRPAPPVTKRGHTQPHVAPCFPLLSDRARTQRK